MGLTSAGLLALLLAAPDGGSARAASGFDAERCPLQVQLRALASVGSARHTWKTLYVHYKTYGQCDAGPVAEGYSYDVVELLSSKWERLDEMARFVEQDAAFLRFVLAHVDETSASEDLEAVQRDARDACLRRHEALCRRLARRAEAALQRQKVVAGGTSSPTPTPTAEATAGGPDGRPSKAAAGKRRASRGSARPSCLDGMAEISGGKYQLGATKKDAPVAPFCLDVTEVTASAYTGCVQAGACREPAKGGHCTYGVPAKANHPVNCVDWKQAVTYCEWAGKRLPTEEEWEWAARGGERGTTYPWGDEEPTNRLCWEGPGNDRGKDDRPGTCPVGSHPRGDSPQGVKDLAGNVWEWTSSADESGSRVLRGGSWGLDGPSFVSAASRGWLQAATGYDNLGFRCAESR